MNIDRPPFQPQPWAPLRPVKTPIVPVEAPSDPPPAVPKIVQYAQTLAAKIGSQSQPKHTHFVFVLDTSGSMISIRNQIETMFKQQLQLVRDAAKDLSTGTTTVSLLVFNHKIRCVYNASSIDSVAPWDSASYVPSGGTALLDAIGAAIELTGTLPAIDGKDTAVFITVLTDGEERDSRIITADAAAAALDLLQKTNAVTFALVGTEKTLSTLGKRLNIPKGLMRGFDPSNLESVKGTVDAMACATTAYSHTRAAGQLSTSNLF